MVTKIEGIKKLLSKKKEAEIRIGLKYAEEFGIDFSDKSIIDLFKEGIAIDIIIKNVGEDDSLPNRLEKYLKDDTNKAWYLDEGFVKVKIVDVAKAKSLQPLEVAGLLLGIFPNDFKVAGQMDEEEGFTKIRVISTKKDRFLNLKEIRDLFAKMIDSEKFQYLAEDI
jgi:hypothetical protein